MKSIIVFFSLVLLFASCSVSKIKSGESYSGSSMDVLQDDQSISARLDGDVLKVKIMAKGEVCRGKFEYVSSSKSYLGFTMASNDYVGMFNKGLGKSCTKAVGNSGGKKIMIQVARLGGVLGSSWMATKAIRICDDAEGICMAKNTFKIEDN